MLWVAAIFALLAAAIQRIAGIGFVLIFLGPAALIFGAYEGQSVTILLALVAAAATLPTLWRNIEWKHSLRIIVPGLMLAPLGVWIVQDLPAAWLLVFTALLAILALTAPHIRFLAPALRGDRGAIITGAVAGLMHTTVGLAGPPIAAHAVGDEWEQRRFAASTQLILAVFGVVSILLRGWPTVSPYAIGTLTAATVLGIIVGTLLADRVPLPRARITMLVLAWAGSLVTLIRGILAVLAR